MRGCILANHSVNVVVRITIDGKQTYLPAKKLGNSLLAYPPKGGVFYLYWRQGSRQRYQRVGSDPRLAEIAQHEQERFLATGRPIPERPVAPPRKTLLAAQEEWLEVKRGKSLDPRCAGRWKKEILDPFRQVVIKQYCDELSARDIYKWMAYLKEQNLAPRTVFNRTQSIGTFLRFSNVSVDFKFKAQKKGGDIPDYVDPTPNFYRDSELEKLFAACTPEERLAFLFFQTTGCREREVAFAAWEDFEWAEPAKEGEPQEASVYKIQAKRDVHFYPKNREGRTVTLCDELEAALLAHRQLHGDRRFVFVNHNGKPQGHFLHKLKVAAKRADLDPKGFTLHRFRRTFATAHHRKGVAIYDIQTLIGHQDQAMLRRYIETYRAKSPEMRALANKTFAKSA